MRISKQQWLIAIGWATLLHMVVIALLIWSPSPPTPSSQTSRGVMVSLDKLDTTPPPPPSIKDMPIEQLKENRLEAANTTNTSGSPSSITNSVAATDAPIEAAQPVTPAISNAPSDQADVAATPETNPSEAASDVSAAPASSAPPSQVSDVGPSDATGTPAIAAALSVMPQQTLSNTAPAEQVTAHDATQPTEANRQGAYGNREQATDAYITKLRAWLGRHKHYPEQARQDHAEGTVKLFLAVNASGKVLESRIAASSGSPVLDAAARQMLDASRPLPPMPSAAERNQLELIIPIVFRLH